MLRHITSIVRKKERLAAEEEEIEPTGVPVLSSAAILTSGFVKAYYSYPLTKYYGFVGTPLIISPAIWENSPEVTRGWWCSTSTSLLSNLNTDSLSYIPTQDDYDNSRKIIWREIATSFGVTKFIYSYGVYITALPSGTKPVSTSFPQLSATSSRSGSTITSISGTWYDPILTGSSLTITRNWIKNGTSTGISTPTYSDTSDGDIIHRMETATNASGTTSQSAYKIYYTSDFVADISQESTSGLSTLVGTQSGGSTIMELFSSRNHTTQVYVRNPNIWCPSLVSQLTGVAAYKSWHNTTESYGGAMITPKHWLSCDHAHPHAPYTPTEHGDHAVSIYRFIKEDNSVVNTYHIWQEKVGSLDLCVGLLDTNVSLSGINVFPVFSLTSNQMNDFNYFEPPLTRIGVSQGYGRPTATIPPVPISDYPQYNNTMAYMTESIYPGFRYTVWDGDSGTSSFVLLNDKLYLYRIITSGGGGGWDIPQYTNEINSAITLCDQNAVAAGFLDAPTGYQLTVEDPFA